MISKFALSIILGFAGHGIKPWNEELFPSPSTNRLVSYAEGGLMIFAAFAMLSHGKKGGRDGALTDLLVAMLAVGLGTAGGTIADYLGTR